MRYPKKLLRVLTVAGVLLLAVACAEVPTTEINNAEQALAAASTAEAAISAETAWITAVEAMTVARSEIAAQKSKLALLRSYDRAVEMLAKTEDLARTAVRASLTDRKEVRQQAEAARVEVRTDLETASNLLVVLEPCPRQPDGFLQDLATLKGNLQSLSDPLAQIETALIDGRFREAEMQANTLQARASELVIDLDVARRKIKC